MNKRNDLLLTFVLELWGDGNFWLSWKDRSAPQLWGEGCSGMSLQEAVKKVKDAVEDKRRERLRNGEIPVTADDVLSVLLQFYEKYDHVPPCDVRTIEQALRFENDVPSDQPLQDFLQCYFGPDPFPHGILNFSLPRTDDDKVDWQAIARKSADQKDVIMPCNP